MTPLYSEYDRFIVNVNCVIIGLYNGRLSILLSRRKVEPEMGRWSLMGGFVRENEGLDEAAKRVLFDFTGLENVFMRQVHTFGAVNRNPGARVISVCYCALVNVDEHDYMRVRGHNASWVDMSDMPDLGFDHLDMVRRALAMVKCRFADEPIAFSLLPRFFTLTQLQQLYEIVLGEQIDKRNFRKRVAENPCIEKTELVDKTMSRRGAALYRYNDSLSNLSRFHM